MKNVLITGGAGFIGSHAAEEFSKDGWRVVVLDNLSRSALFDSKKKSVEYNWKFLGTCREVHLIYGDIRDVRKVTSLFQKWKFDLIIHAASQPGIRKSIESPVEDFEINAVGTLNVLEALRKTNPKGAFVYLSTNKVYGENVASIPLKEKKTRYEYRNLRGVPETMSVDLTGHTPYGASKYAGDLYTQEYGITYGLRTAVFRMSCIYGTRQFGFEDQGWIAWFIIAALTGKPIHIYGNGKQVRDVLYVKDLITAIRYFYDSKMKQGVWNMGGGSENTTSLLELVSFIEKILRRKLKLHYSNWRSMDQRVYITDISKLRREFNWRPTWTVQRGIKVLFDWIEENKRLFR